MNKETRNGLKGIVFGWAFLIVFGGLVWLGITFPVLGTIMLVVLMITIITGFLFIIGTVTDENG